MVNRRQGTESDRLANDLGKAAPKWSFRDYLPMALQYSFNLSIITRKSSGTILYDSLSIHVNVIKINLPKYNETMIVGNPDM